MAKTKWTRQGPSLDEVNRAASPPPPEQPKQAEPPLLPCPDCDGTSLEAGACPTCKGEGTVRRAPEPPAAATRVPVEGESKWERILNPPATAPAPSATVSADECICASSTYLERWICPVHGPQTAYLWKSRQLEASTPSSGISSIRAIAKDAAENIYNDESVVETESIDNEDTLERWIRIIKYALLAGGVERLEHECLRWQATADRHQRDLRDAEEREQELERHLSEYQQANDKAAKEWHRLNGQLTALRAEKEAVERELDTESRRRRETELELDSTRGELAAARQEQGALRAKITEWREASDRLSYQCADELEALLTEVKR